MAKRQIHPGDLIRGKNSMRPALWEEYDAHEISSDAGVIRRVTMGDRVATDLNEDALVVAVYSDHDIPHDIDVLLLYLPVKRGFYYTWSSYVMKLNERD
jgi:hypothetical protein